MKRTMVFAAATLALLVGGVAAAEEGAPESGPFGGQVLGSTHLSATVKAVDPETREVTLENSEGETSIVVAGPEVRNFAQIEVGDQVDIEYIESVTLLVGEGDDVPAREDDVEIARAAEGEKPAGAIVSTTRVLAEVEAIDHEARTVTLKGPQRTVTIEVGEEAVNFHRVEVGDKVYLEFTQAVAAAVTKAAD